MSYMALKHLHMTSAVLGFLLLLVRGVWMMRDSGLLDSKVSKILPHVINTVLLLSAIGLMIQLKQYPFVEGWVTTKLLALVAYIVLGVIAMKGGRTKPVRIAAFAGAVATFAFILSVAITRHPAGFLGAL